MFCPQCGQQQVSGDSRFCSRCGFPLNVITEVLASGGNLPARAFKPEGRALSPRQKGVRQGAMLMLSTLLIVPLVAIFSVFILDAPEIFVPLASIGLFVGGLLRIFYALLLEEGEPKAGQQQPASQLQASYVPPALASQMHRQERGAALPSSQGIPVPSFMPPRRDTGELTPPSVTENTTRLLDERGDAKRQQ